MGTVIHLNASGLPLPGRELDAWVHEHIFGWVWCKWNQPFDDAGSRTLVPPDSEMLPHWGEATGEEPKSRFYYCRCAEVSTTHAFFQVMEQFKAKGWDIDFFWDDGHLIAHLHFCELNGVEWEYATVRIPWRDTIEETYAHAVWCCAWKAMGGENA